VAHACTVVLNSNELLASLLDVEPNRGPASIDGILNQLLDNAGRSFDDFSGRDPVDDLLVKYLLDRGSKKVKNLVVLDRLIGYGPFCTQNLSPTR
jgi:hypothetical protein